MREKFMEVELCLTWDPAGGFLLWGGPSSSWDLTELKFNLFSWHRPSFFGTFLPETEYQGHKVIKLSPVTALDFLARPPRSEFFSIKGSRELSNLQKAASWIKEMLSQGNWMPDFTKWREGKMGWKFLVPPELEQGTDIFYLGEWIDAIFRELMEKNPDIRQAWQSLENNYSLLRPENSLDMDCFEEDDWLEAVGWKQNHTPFVTCLQLVEPGPFPAWTLKTVLQDKENPQLIFDYPAEGREEGDPCPESWQPYLGETAKVFRKWNKILPWLKDPSHDDAIIHELTEDQAWDFLTSGSMKLAEKGYPVFLPSWWDEIRQLKPKIKARTRSSVGSAAHSLFGLEQIVQFDWKVALGDTELNPEEFKQLAAEKRRLLKFKDRWVCLDPLLVEELKKFLKEKKKGMTLGEVLQTHLLSGEASNADAGAESDKETDPVPVELELDSDLSGMIGRLTQFSSMPVEPPPRSFQGTLRNYQRNGYSWLLFLRSLGLGGCLADDMGLGKTIQLIAYFLEIKAKEPYLSPSLLICPTSVIGNWQMELKRFAPELKVYVHYGPKRRKGEEFAPAVEGCDLVVTSYALAHFDREELGSLHWNSICLDEAQNIKNAYTKQAGAIKMFQGRHRIALTGTPMENRLTELWSIMDFLNPGYLGGLTTFKRKFVNVIEKTKDATVVSRVQRLVRPFLLRRMKNDPAIELDLPEKQEFKEYIALTEEQAALYESVLEDMFRRLAAVGGMEKRGIILATLTKLKQVCNHPNLLLKERKNRLSYSRSGKITRLLEMVNELREVGDRCLIFTQFVEMGHMLQETLGKKLKEPVQFLHGGTSKAQRDAMIARFQDQTLPREKGCGIFILSLRAGGTGLNLTAANHVFHFDRWWNPAVENQATDRTYRIGQSRHVLVHKFITLGTLEERIDEMIEQKQGLSEMIVGGGENWITEMSTEELREIFTLRKEWVEVS